MDKVAGVKAWNWLKRDSFFTHFFQKPYLQNTFEWLLLLIRLFQPKFYHFFHPFLHVFPFIIDIVGKGIPGPLLFKASTSWPSLPPFLKCLLALPSFLFHPLLRYFRQFPHPHTNKYQMRHSMEHNKQMILRTLKRYINGTVLLHVGKRYRIITADWIVLWGWALSSWWIPIRWLYFFLKKTPLELQRSRWNKSQ